MLMLHFLSSDSVLVLVYNTYFNLRLLFNPTLTLGKFNINLQRVVQSNLSQALSWEFYNVTS